MTQYRVCLVDTVNGTRKMKAYRNVRMRSRSFVYRGEIYFIPQEAKPCCTFWGTKYYFYDLEQNLPLAPEDVHMLMLEDNAHDITFVYIIALIALSLGLAGIIGGP